MLRTRSGRVTVANRAPVNRQRLRVYQLRYGALARAHVPVPAKTGSASLLTNEIRPRGRASTGPFDSDSTRCQA
jgi:hypothetical protein